MIKSRYKPEFDQWTERANENQVKVLADACRSLRYFTAGDQAPTTYHATHKDFPDHVSKAPREKDNSQNRSEAVPLGSIYKKSEKEEQAEKMALEKKAATIVAAAKKQAEWRSGSPEATLDMTLSGTFEIPGATIHKNMQAMRGSVLKSLTKESWHGKVHSYEEIKRHDHKSIKMGETNWNLCGMTGNGISERIYALRDPKHFPGGGLPNRKRVVKGKMVHFEEHWSDDRQGQARLSANGVSCAT